MKQQGLSEFCIYSIKKSDDLLDAYEHHKEWSFSEAKNWASARTLFLKATDSGKLLPIVFADANECDLLYYWGILTDVQIEKIADNKYKTTCRFKDMKEIKGKKKKTALIVESSGEHMGEGFIRSYAICRTPKFIY